MPALAQGGGDERQGAALAVHGPLSYLNAVLPKAIYNHAGETLMVTKDYRIISIHGGMITGAGNGARVYLGGGSTLRIICSVSSTSSFPPSGPTIDTAGIAPYPPPRTARSVGR